MASETDPSLGGRLAIVTGANAGLGKEISRCLRDDGYHVIMACRSQERALAAIDDLGPSDVGKLEFMQLDLANLGSVRSFCASFEKLAKPLDLLVCNGGINGASSSGRPTVDGFDEVFATNYLGHYLMCSLLTPRLPASGGSIIMITSVMHRHAQDPHEALTDGAIRDHKGLYSLSKLAQILHVRELQRRLPGTLIFSVNPGGVATDIWRGYPRWQQAVIQRCLASAADVARAVVDMRMERQAVYCNTQRLAGYLPWNLGEYLGPTAAQLVPTTPSPAACDAELARRLFSDSARWVGLECAE